MRGVSFLSLSLFLPLFLFLFLFSLFLFLSLSLFFSFQSLTNTSNFWTKTRNLLLWRPQSRGRVEGLNSLIKPAYVFPLLRYILFAALFFKKRRLFFFFFFFFSKAENECWRIQGGGENMLYSSSVCLLVRFSPLLCVYLCVPIIAIFGQRCY